MPVTRQVTLGEALEKGYEIIHVPTQADLEAQEPGFVDQTAIIGLEVVPAILGGIGGGVAGAAGGPPGVVAGVALGGAAGGAAGNSLSQSYRLARGFQEEFSPGELAAATAFSAIPLGALPGKGALARTLLRGGQGAGLAAGETAARTLLEDARLPSQDELVTSILFGGAIGGALGRVEASWLNKTLDVDNISEDMARGDVVDAIEEVVKTEEDFHVGRPNVPKRMEGEVPGEYAERILYTTESQVYPAVEDAVVAMAEGGPSPYANKEGLESLARTFDENAVRGSEVFRPYPNQARIARAEAEGYEDFLDFKKQFLIERGVFEDTQALTEVRAKIAAKDHQFGRGKGAKKERAAWAGEERRLLNKMGLGGLEEAMVGRQLARPMEPLPPGGAMLQRGPDQVLAKRISPLKDRPMEQAGFPSKYEQAALDVLGPNYERLWTGLITTGAGGAALAANLWDEDENALSQAGLSQVFAGALMAMLGVKGAKRLRALPGFRQAAKNPQAARPITIKSGEIDNLRNNKGFIEPPKYKKYWDDGKEIVSNMLDPLSRRLKKIGPILTGIFRDHDRRVNRKTTQYLDRVTPYVTAMTKKLSKADFTTWKHALLNGERQTILALNKKARINDKLYGEMESALNRLREYARSEGAVDVGYLDNYFPRQVKDYKALKEFLDSKRNVFGEEINQIDEAVAKYAEDNGYASKDLVPLEEKAEIASRVLRGYRLDATGLRPGNINPRRISQLDSLLLDAYADPADSLKRYVEGMVQATERGRFFFRKPLKPDLEGGFPGSKDRRASDLGFDMSVDDSLAGELARRLGKENNLTADQVKELQKITQARFSGKTIGPLTQGIKNLNYMQILGNFGSAVTQLGDLAYSIHFHGFDNTFKSAFAKDFDFVKHFGLNHHEIDAVTSSSGLSKALNFVLDKMQFKRLDQFGKNTTMNASWRKMKQRALGKDSTALRDELAEAFGGDRANEMIRDLKRTKIGKDAIIPDSVEEAIWYKFLDLSPSTLTEMPSYYTGQGNWRILYMLKSFTLKQFDIFRQAGIDDISKGKQLYAEGKKSEGAKLAAKGAKNLVGLAVVFGAANAGTDLIKDTLYGRPIKPARTVVDNAWKLIGLNRYLLYQSKRKGAAKAIIDGLLPPTAVFDRAWQDISALATGDEYKGAMLQGTPLDMIYWRYLGGVEKSKRLERED